MICENCGQEHDGSYASGRFCGPKCSRSYSAKSNNRQRIQNIKIASERSIKLGTHHNFTGNAMIIESYWREELQKLGFLVELDYKVQCDDIDNNNHYYRMDLLVNSIIDLEIDGSHFHDDPETLAKDRRRDDYLKNLGYLVYRVPYINPKRRYDDFMKQVSEFVDWYNNLNL